MKPNEYKLSTRVWIYPTHAGWHFVSIPPKETEDISQKFNYLKRGWGSLRVKVTVGKTTWNTSIFPDKKEGIYLLPIKKEVRKKENISANQRIKCIVEILIS
ncbi:DUF1905 domain-containing protein [Patescibacteria group bacterium]